MRQITYVGPYTELNLNDVKCGLSRISSIRAMKRHHAIVCDFAPRLRNADYELSLDEVLSVLEPLEDRTPKALIATLYECQATLTDIERCPEQYATEYLTPDVAREWYSSQIGTIRRLLQR